MEQHEYEIRRPEVEETLRSLGRILKSAMPPYMGFTLLIYDFGKDGAMFYLSSAERKTMIESMEEFIEKQKKLL